MKYFIFALLLLVLVFNPAVITHAAVKLPSIISNNMVLQQKSKAALWGWADAGEKVSVTSSWNSKTVTVTATPMANG